jgi:nicotinamidase-related amidase
VTARQGTRLPPETALLLIDVVNPFDFDGAARMLRHALPAARRIEALKERAVRARVPVIYVNDNYGDWHADFADLVARCRDPESRGSRFVEHVVPEGDDYYVLKPLHSGFQSTSLAVLLDRLGIGTVVLVGVAAHICVWFTAIDAYMRGLDVVVPRDCVASERAHETRVALEQMAGVLKARIADSRSLRFARARSRRRNVL